MRTCTKCKLDKPLDRFTKSTQTKSGYLGYCKDCDNLRKRASEAKLKEENPEAWKEKQDQYRKTYRNNHKEKVAASDRRRSLIAKFGITPEQYDELLQRQNGVCAICDEAPGKRRFAVDHDHSCCPTQKTCGLCIRGLLCSNCNTALGLLKEDRDRILKMIKYVGAE